MVEINVFWGICRNCFLKEYINGIGYFINVVILLSKLCGMMV